jgi:hypothetical protein
MEGTTETNIAFARRGAMQNKLIGSFREVCFFAEGLTEHVR